MSDMLKSALSALPNAASSPLALVAYVLALLVWLVVALKVKRNKALLEHIDKLPRADRLKALQLEMGSVDIREGLTPEQWIRSRIHLYYFVAFAILCLTIVLVFTIAAATSRASASNEIALDVIGLGATSSIPEYDTIVTESQRLTYIKWTTQYRFVNRSAADALLTDVTLTAQNADSIRIVSEPKPRVARVLDSPTGPNGPRSEGITPLATDFPIQLAPYSSVTLAVTFLLTVYEDGERVSFGPSEVDYANSRIAHYFGVGDDEVESPKIAYRLALTLTTKAREEIIAKYDIRELILLPGKGTPAGLVVSGKRVGVLETLGTRMENRVQTVMYGAGGSVDYYRLGDEELRRHVAYHPDDLGGYLALSTRLYVNGSYDEAAAVLAQYSPKGAAERAMIKNNLGAVEFGKENYAKGLSHLEESIRLAPCEDQPFHNIKEYHIFRKDYRAASLTAKRVLRDCASNVGYWANELFALVPYTDDIRADLQYFLKASELEPDDGDLAFYVGSIYAQIGDAARAVDLLKRAVSLGTRHELRALNNAAGALIQLEEFEEAADFAKRVIGKNADYFYGHYNLAYIYLRKGGYREAIREYKRAIELDPNFGQAYSELADAYAAIGEDAAAAENRALAQRLEKGK